MNSIPETIDPMPPEQVMPLFGQIVSKDELEEAAAAGRMIAGDIAEERTKPAASLGQEILRKCEDPVRRRQIAKEALTVAAKVANLAL